MSIWAKKLSIEVVIFVHLRKINDLRRSETGGVLACGPDASPMPSFAQCYDSASSYPPHTGRLTRWRNSIGEEGEERMLTQTIQAGRKSRVIVENSAKRVIVETTVMEKNIA